MSAALPTVRSVAMVLLLLATTASAWADDGAAGLPEEWRFWFCVAEHDLPEDGQKPTNYKRGVSLGVASDYELQYHTPDSLTISTASPDDCTALYRAARGAVEAFEFDPETERPRGPCHVRVYSLRLTVGRTSAEYELRIADPERPPAVLLAMEHLAQELLKKYRKKDHPNQ